MHLPNRRILRLIALALAAQMLLSWPLWDGSAGRTFPMVPLFGLSFPQNPDWDQVQAWLTLVWLGGAVLFPRSKNWPAALMAWFGWLILQDQNRLQPWMYFYLLSWGLLWLAPARRPELSDTWLRWLIAAVYAWGGFNKITPYFAADNFPWFCEAFFWTKPLGQSPVAGYAVALAELLFAPALLWGKTRRVARWMVVGFHVFIAAALSPAGLDWNTVVIPWNLVMAGMVWVLFAPGQQAPPLQTGVEIPPIIRATPPAVLVFLALAWLFPVLNIFHAWDEPLSWKMYSNTQTEASFYTTGTPCPEIAGIWKKFAYDEGTKLLLDDWSMYELHVPAYNSPRTFRQIARYLCSCSSGEAGLLLLSVGRWDKSAQQETFISCKDPF